MFSNMLIENILNALNTFKQFLQNKIGKINLFLSSNIFLLGSCSGIIYVYTLTSITQTVSNQFHVIRLLVTSKLPHLLNIHIYSNNRYEMLYNYNSYYIPYLQFQLTYPFILCFVMLNVVGHKPI